MIRRFITTKKPSKKFLGKKYGYESNFVLEKNPESCCYIRQHNLDSVLILKDKYATHVEPINFDEMGQFQYFGNHVEAYVFKNKNVWTYLFVGDLEGFYMIKIMFDSKEEAKNYVPEEEWVDVTYNNNYEFENLYSKPLQDILEKIKKELEKKQKQM